MGKTIALVKLVVVDITLILIEIVRKYFAKKRGEKGKSIIIAGQRPRITMLFLIRELIRSN